MVSFRLPHPSSKPCPKAKAPMPAKHLRRIGEGTVNNETAPVGGDPPRLSGEGVSHAGQSISFIGGSGAMCFFNPVPSPTTLFLSMPLLPGLVGCPIAGP